jgi:N-acetylglutamate synthase-like GNAT family acetyltransferase
VIENSLTEREWRVRRAVVDDLGPLAELWRAAHMRGESLEKQFTDFQVAEDGAGRLQAAVALQISGPSGRIHSEAIADFALADTLRPLLWERLRAVAQNHGLFRLWTQESAPFWKKDAGFAPASKEAKEKFP